MCDGLCFGLIYQTKLVGTVSARIVDMMVYGESMKVPIVEMLCIHSQIREMGLSRCLIKAIQEELISMGYSHTMFASGRNMDTFFCKMYVYVIPINVRKLQQIGFLEPDVQPLNRLYRDNPLHLLKESDISNLVPILNGELSKHKIHQVFSVETAKKYLLPKKSVVYTFVIKKDEVITDMINVHQHYFYSIDTAKIITVAHVNLYFCTSISVVMLITYLLPKLLAYGFDQLTYCDDDQDNSNIDITRYESGNIKHIYWHNVKIKKHSVKDIASIIF